jgi:cyclopropane fatty-acyl-phospholipid synthase-like methyltransferase
MSAQAPQNGVRTFFRAEAERFDSIYGGPRTLTERLIDRLFHRVIRLRYERTMALLGDVTDRRVLDVGCGPGHYLVELAARGAREAVGVDFTEEMLELARAAAALRGVRDQCRFVRGDFLDVPLTGPFDACVAIGYFEYLAEPLAHMQRMTELTRGSVIASFPKRYTLRTLPRAIRYRSRGCFLRFFTATEVRRLAERAGLESIEVHSVSRDFVLHGTTTA